MLRLNLLIQLTERVTAPVRKIRSAFRTMGADGQRDVGKVGRAIDKLAASGSKLSRAFTFAGLRTRLTGVIAKVRELSGRAGMKGLELASYGAGYAIGKTLKMVGRFALRGAAVVAGGAGLLGGWLTGGVIGIASKFEQFQVILENTEGSAEKAKRSMAWVKQFAKTTPYEVEEVMQAFVALKSYGLDPIDGTLRSLGDAASGMGKPLMQAVEMMADAQTGEFERLKEFGIKAKVQGDKVAFAFVQNGKDMTVSARNRSADIKKALTGIFDSKFKGMMDRQSRTFSGLWSNLKDSFTDFQLSIANAGIFDFIKGKLQILMAKLTELANNGTLARWAEKISTWMERAGSKIWDFAVNTDWDQLGSDLRSIGSAIMTVVNALNSLASGPGLPAWMTQKYEGLIPWLGRKFNGAMMGPLSATSPAPGRRAPAGRSPAPIRPRAMPLREPGWSVRRAPAQQVGGRLDIKIHTDNGARASVTRLSTVNQRVPLSVTRAPTALAG